MSVDQNTDLQAAPGCVCYLREDIDRGDVWVAPEGGCPIHTPWAFDCTYRLEDEVRQAAWTMLPAGARPWPGCLCVLVDSSHLGDLFKSPAGGCPVHTPWVFHDGTVRDLIGQYDALAVRLEALVGVDVKP